MTESKMMCEVCGKEAEFACGSCGAVGYCDMDHQKKHWKESHKRDCMSLSYQQNEQEKKILVQQRLEKRKQYYNLFSGQKYDECLYVVKELEAIELENAKISKVYADEFEHAATVCLHIKTLQLLNDKLAARDKLTNFLKTNRIVSDVRSLPVKTNINDESKTFFTNKLNLLASLANLSYNLGISPVELYTIYTENVEIVFGKESLEASNCYFMMGHYYFDEGQTVKSIACFKRAAQMRDEGAFDCYINMGVCYKALKRNNKAIEMFLKAIQRLIQQNNEHSDDAAQLNEYLAITYLEDLSFPEGIRHLETAYLIRSKDPDSAKCKELNRLIVFLYSHMDKYVEDGLLEKEKPELFKYLKENVFSLRMEFEKEETKPVKKEGDKSPRKKSEKEPQLESGLEKDILGGENNEEEKERIEMSGKQEIQVQTTPGSHSDMRMNIPKGMVESLEPEQICYLARLQLELQNCHTEYRIISAYNKSPFITSLSQQQRRQFKVANIAIFKDMDIANPKEDELDKKKVKKAVAPLDFTNLQRNK